jgi:low temperature requirement protein LtrA
LTWSTSFILIALGESIVVTGAALAGFEASHRPVGGQVAAAFCVAFAGSAGLWWLYFDRSAEAAARVIARSADPGRLGRSAYHLIHPVMVAGIIVIAAADRTMLARPAAVGVAATAWLILGGTGLYIAGHAAFKAVVWRELSWPGWRRWLRSACSAWSRRTCLRSYSAAARRQSCWPSLPPTRSGRGESGPRLRSPLPSRSCLKPAATVS